MPPGGLWPPLPNVCLVVGQKLATEGSPTPAAVREVTGGGRQDGPALWGHVQGDEIDQDPTSEPFPLRQGPRLAGTCRSVLAQRSRQQSTRPSFHTMIIQLLAKKGEYYNKEANIM